MEGREIKNRLYDQVARIGKAVASAKRLELLEVLCQGEKAVEALAKSANIDMKNTSAHLKELKAARLVESRKDGKYVYYRLADESVAKFWVAMRSLAEERLTELQTVVRQYLAVPQQFMPQDRKTILGKARAGEIVVIDVRPEPEFRARHLPYARSLPLEELEQRLEDLPRDKEIVAYCRGPYCLMAIEAVALLRKEGFRAVRLDDGVAEWAAAGLRTISGSVRG